MALIECPECKASVSDKASACVKCGFPLGQVKCADCGTVLPAQTGACPQCGCPAPSLASAAASSELALESMPRFDGIYVSRAFAKNHGELPGDWVGNVFRRMSRPVYLRAYLRFFEDGLLVYAGGVVNHDPAPARPSLDRSWGDESHRYRWTANGAQLRITAPGGHASTARIDQDRVVWDEGTSWMGTGDDVFEFQAP